MSSGIGKIGEKNILGELVNLDIEKFENLKKYSEDLKKEELKLKNEIYEIIK
ncbi:MAG: hypothetical protein HFJ45_00290 [Clostridia bacterium]|nr:hypothetical protein [Clostridia bacterium]